MHCPECGGEYREGFTECVDCGVPLIAAAPPPVPHPDVRLVTVLEASDPALLAVAESLLLEAEIPHLNKNDRVQDLFAMGRIGGVSPLTGPVRIQVPEEHEENARALLADLIAQATDGPGEPEGVT